MCKYIKQTLGGLFPCKRRGCRTRLEVKNREGVGRRERWCKSHPKRLNILDSRKGSWLAVNSTIEERQAERRPLWVFIPIRLPTVSHFVCPIDTDARAMTAPVPFSCISDIRSAETVRFDCKEDLVVRLTKRTFISRGGRYLYTPAKKALPLRGKKASPVFVSATDQKPNLSPEEPEPGPSKDKPPPVVHRGPYTQKYADDMKVAGGKRVTGGWDTKPSW